MAPGAAGRESADSLRKKLLVAGLIRRWPGRNGTRSRWGLADWEQFLARLSYPQAFVLVRHLFDGVEQVDLPEAVAEITGRETYTKGGVHLLYKSALLLLVPAAEELVGPDSPARLTRRTRGRNRGKPWKYRIEGA